MEIEEVPPPGTGNGEVVLSRYLHTIRDTRRRSFVHLDGAIRVYDANAYGARHQKAMPDVGRMGRRIKMFRVDGDIPNDEWANLVSYYFRQNGMVAEYIDPDYRESRN